MNNQQQQEADRILMDTRQLLDNADRQDVQQLIIRIPETMNLSSRPVSIAVAGAYSSGKSTLLKALTGHPDIAIGAGITTEALQILPWEDAILIDTPGIHTELRPEHDAAAYKALTEADLLVFVITNELFDAGIIDHFNQLAENRDKSAETLLIVNKMSRHYLGNTPEAQGIIKEDLAKVLPAAQMSSVAFIDARDAVTATQEKDPDRQARLLHRSNFESCSAQIKNFIAAKGRSAQSTTTLYQIERALTQALELTEDDLGKRLIQAENQLRQQKEITAESIDAWIAAADNFSHNAQQEVHTLQEQALLSYGETLKVTDEDEYNYSETLQRIAERLRDKIVESHREHRDRLATVLQDHWRTDHILHLMEDLKSRFHNPEIGLGTARLAGPLTGLFDTAANASGSLSNLPGVSGSVMHEAVLGVGHFFGKSFHPWEALKLARGIGIAGAVIGPVLTIGLQVLDDYQEAQKQKRMQEDRRNIIGIFQEVGNNLQQVTHESIQETAEAWREESIAPLDAAIAETDALRQARQEWKSEVARLQTATRKLIQQIHRQEGS